MRISPRLVFFALAVVAIGLGAYIWFVRVPAWSCSDEAIDRERAFTEFTAAFESIGVPRATLVPPLGGETDEYIDQIKFALAEIEQDRKEFELISERYFSAVDRHQKCQTEDKSIL